MSSRLRLNDAPDVLNVKQAAQVLGVSADVVYESIHRNDIRAVRLGRRLLIAKAEVMRLLGLHRNGVDDEAGAASPAAQEGVGKAGEGHPGR